MRARGDLPRRELCAHASRGRDARRPQQVARRRPHTTDRAVVRPAAAALVHLPRTAAQHLPGAPTQPLHRAGNRVRHGPLGGHHRDVRLDGLPARPHLRTRRAVGRTRRLRAAGGWCAHRRGPPHERRRARAVSAHRAGHGAVRGRRGGRLAHHHAADRRLPRLDLISGRRAGGGAPRRQARPSRIDRRAPGRGTGDARPGRVSARRRSGRADASARFRTRRSASPPTWPSRPPPICSAGPSRRTTPCTSTSTRRAPRSSKTRSTTCRARRASR